MFYICYVCGFKYMLVRDGALVEELYGLSPLSKNCSQTYESVPFQKLFKLSSVVDWWESCFNKCKEIDIGKYQCIINFPEK